MKPRTAAWHSSTSAMVSLTSSSHSRRAPPSPWRCSRRRRPVRMWRMIVLRRALAGQQGGPGLLRVRR